MNAYAMKDVLPFILAVNTKIINKNNKKMYLLVVLCEKAFCFQKQFARVGLLIG